MRQLIAFSTVALLSFAAAANAAERKIGAWTLTELRDPVDDSVRSVAMLKGEGGYLVLKCDKAGPGSTYVHMISDEYLGGRGGRYDSRDVLMRFDAAPASSAPWDYRDSSAILTDNTRVNGFLASLASTDRLVLRATTFRYNSVDLIFPVAKPSQVISAIRSSCADPASS